MVFSDKFVLIVWPSDPAQQFKAAAALSAIVCRFTVSPTGSLQKHWPLCYTQYVYDLFTAVTLHKEIGISIIGQVCSYIQGI